MTIYGTEFSRPSLPVLVKVLAENKHYLDAISSLQNLISDTLETMFIGYPLPGGFSNDIDCSNLTSGPNSSVTMETIFGWQQNRAKYSLCTHMRNNRLIDSSSS